MSNKRVSKVLKVARGFIEKGWCKFELAVDANGIPVDSKSKRAERWCAVGALQAATKNYTEAWDALALALPARGPDSVIDFNNRARGKRQVLALFDRAIAMME